MKRYHARRMRKYDIKDRMDRERKAAEAASFERAEKRRSERNWNTRFLLWMVGFPLALVLIGWIVSLGFEP